MSFKNLKSIIIQAISDSTAHGLPNIIKSEKLFLKIFWIIIFILSSSYAINFILDSVNAYLSYESVTKIEVTKDLPSQFPAVSICNINPFTTKFAKEYTRNISIGFTDKNDSLIINRLYKKTFLQSNIMSSQLNDEQRRSFSLKINESLIDCVFSFTPCSRNEFSWFYDFIYGNCYTINEGKTLSNNLTIPFWTSSNPGTINGLQLWIYVGNSSHETISNSGIHIFIHNHSFTPLCSDGINAAPGMETNIIVRRVYDEKLPPPFNDCIKELKSPDAFESELYKVTFKKNSIYKQTNCYEACKQKYVMKKCNCSVSFFPKLHQNLVDCLSMEKIDCIFQYLPPFVKYNFTDYCSNFCPKECDSVYYPLSTSFTDFPTYDFYEKLLNTEVIKKHFPNGIDYATLKKSVLAVNVYYEELIYTKFTQLPQMSVLDLISNIGGILGLFIGISFLSFAEIISVFIEIAIVLFESKYYKKSKNFKTQVQKF